MTTKQSKAFDLSILDTVAGGDEGFDLELKHPVTGEELGMVIHLIGGDSAEWGRIDRARRNKRLDKLQKSGRLKNITQVTEENERESIHDLATASRSWKTKAVMDDKGNIIDPEKKTLLFGGKEYEHTTENAIYLFGRLPWMKEQVDIAIGDRANFIKG